MSYLGQGQYSYHGQSSGNNYNGNGFGRPPSGFSTGPSSGYGGHPPGSTSQYRNVPSPGPPLNYGGGPPLRPPPGSTSQYHNAPSPGPPLNHGGGPPPGPPPQSYGYREFQGGPPPGPPGGYQNQMNSGHSETRQENRWNGNQNQNQGGYGNHQFGDPGAQFSRPPTNPQPFGGIDGYNFQYSNCTGRRKALLIGINYIGSKQQLKGCINDVHNVKNFLMQHGYKDEDTVILTEEGNNPRSIPTRENIIRGMRWLVKDAQMHDSFFFHYSGHGGRTKDLDRDEVSGFDNVIYPLDHERAGFIVDDEIHDIMVRPLHSGVRLTALFDCCNSGTSMDLPYVYSTKGILKEPNLLKDTGVGLLSAANSYASGDINGVVSSVTQILQRVTNGNSGRERTIRTKTSPSDCIMFSGCKDTQTSADTFEGGQATGAMSHAFITVMTNNPNQSYLTLLKNMRKQLEEKYEQKPQLSSSHPIDCNLKFIF